MNRKQLQWLKNLYPQAWRAQTATAYFDVYLVGIIGSLIFSCIAIVGHDLVNEDAIVYFRAAEAFPLGGWQLAHSIYEWPFYPLLLYCGHTITGLSLEYVAYIYSSIFYMLITVSFSAITQALGFEKKVVWLSLPIILLFPALNDYRAYIVRDAGFYAFYLMSLYWIIVYLERDKKFALFGWLFSAVVATLFRIEGTIYIALVPIILLFCRANWKQRLHDITILGVPLLIIIVLLVGSVVMYFGVDFFEKSLSRLHELKTVIVEYIPHWPQLFAQKSQIIQSQILHASVTPGYSILFLAIGLTGYYIAEVYSALGIIFTILIVLGFCQWRRYLSKDTDTGIARAQNPMAIVFGYAIIGFLITYTFVCLNFFVNARYVIAMCLALLLLAIPGAHYVVDKIKTFTQPMRSITQVLIVLVMVYLMCSGIIRFGYSRDYIYNAGRWAKTHVTRTNNAGEKLRIYSNNRQLMYYSQLYSITSPEWQQFTIPVVHYSSLKLLQHAQLRNYDMLLIRVPRQDKEIVDGMLKDLPFHEIKRFQNKRGDAVVVLQRTA